MRNRYQTCRLYLNLLKMTAMISRTKIVMIEIVIIRFVAILRAANSQYETMTAVICGE